MLSEIARLQVLLEGIQLPASKHELIRYARSQEGDDVAVRLLERLPARDYRSLDEVGEQLAPVRPHAERPVSVVPREESDAPPGGDEYVDSHPTSGEVRLDAPPDNPPQKILEQQSKLQKEQQERQKKLLGG